jgi:hypothetical protein
VSTVQHLRAHRQTQRGPTPQGVGDAGASWYRMHFDRKDDRGDRSDQGDEGGGQAVWAVREPAKLTFWLRRKTSCPLATNNRLHYVCCKKASYGGRSSP